LINHHDAMTPYHGGEQVKLIILLLAWGFLPGQVAFQSLRKVKGKVLDPL
jgi:hypothetical protein